MKQFENDGIRIRLHGYVNLVNLRLLHIHNCVQSCMHHINLDHSLARLITFMTFSAYDFNHNSKVIETNNRFNTLFF